MHLGGVKPSFKMLQMRQASQHLRHAVVVPAVQLHKLELTANAGRFQLFGEEAGMLNIPAFRT